MVKNLRLITRKKRFAMVGEAFPPRRSWSACVAWPGGAAAAGMAMTAALLGPVSVNMFRPSWWGGLIM
jgi:hypothetical protein